MKLRRSFWKNWDIKPEDITAGKLSGISRQIKNYKKLAEELGVGEIDTS